MIVRFNVKRNDPPISNINDSSVRPGSYDYSRSLAGQKSKQWLARLVAAVLAPLRLEHGPLDLIGLTPELLDREANLLVRQVRFLNLDDGHWSCSLALFVRRTVREPTIAPAMNPIIKCHLALAVEAHDSRCNSSNNSSTDRTRHP